jgi:IS5 family transposase
VFDKGYRGHDAPPGRIFISGEKRGVFGVIKRELRRRSAIDCDGHLETEGYLGRRHLKGRAGHAANAILAAVGYNLQCILAWDRLSSWPQHPVFPNPIAQSNS